MSTKIQSPKGTADVLPDEAARWRFVEKIARETAALYRFGEIRTPVFEATELFHRGVGETTDIVQKETFTFEDRGKRSITLRPEGTAGVVRAAMQGSMLDKEGARAKLFYLAPMFRDERAQHGRFRQHHQFGAEAFGVAEAEQDVECIQLQMDFYRRCGLKEVSLRVNSLGDAESKARFRDALVSHLAPYANELSEDSRRRLEDNPLRILDSKSPADQKALEDFTLPADVLTDRSRRHFERVAELLELSELAFEIDQRLVRGFDYYTETLWEVVAGGLGAQNAVGGGGRYDNLVELLGGRPTPGVGFGSGLERLLLALEAQGVSLPDDSPPLAWVVWQGEAAEVEALKLLAELRRADIAADLDPTGRSFKAQLKVANRENARVCLILGEDEVAGGTVTLKDFQTGVQTSISCGEAVERTRFALQPPPGSLGG